MEWFLRWGNWAVAKMVEVLFNTSHLSDVGCTYRLFTREVAELVAERMKVGGNHAGPEMMLLAITSGARFVEIPVNYLPRVGTSSATGCPAAAILIGLRMIEMILRFRIRTPRRIVRPERLGDRRRFPGRAAVSEETFDRIAGEYDESLPPHVVEHYLEQAGRLHRRELPPRAAGRRPRRRLRDRGPRRPPRRPRLRDDRARPLRRGCST